MLLALVTKARVKMKLMWSTLVEVVGNQRTFSHPTKRERVREKDVKFPRNFRIGNIRYTSITLLSCLHMATSYYALLLWSKWAWFCTHIALLNSQKSVPFLCWFASFSRYIFFWPLSQFAPKMVRKVSPILSYVRLNSVGKWCYNSHKRRLVSMPMSARKTSGL